MTKHMLIDATHPEETRVVVVDGQRLEEFDVETAQKKPLKGNIYLAKVVRVEPSLQAAFVDYGGNRHGFLAFNEIHPDYYRIPIADREALIAEEAEAYSEQAEDEDDRTGGAAEGDEAPIAALVEPETGSEDAAAADPAGETAGNRAFDEPADADDRSRDAWQEEGAGASGSSSGDLEPDTGSSGETGEDADDDGDDDATDRDERRDNEARAGDAEDGTGDGNDRNGDESLADERTMALRRDGDDPVLAKSGDSIADAGQPAEAGRVEEVAAVKQTARIETVGGDEIDEAKQRRRIFHRRYKIQEVIKRRQIMLVQVTKEERGTKGAALTTYLSLAGRYCVLMPNTGRGGGISRKISNPGDRKRLKSVLDELGIPDGMSVIVRTAGSERTKAEIRRDCDYLLRLWDGIREQTLKSTAPALIHEEANLIKRSIRDLYARDIEDVIVEGDEGYKAAKSFMRMLMPSHAKRVQQYKDAKIPLFQRYHVESQLDAIHSPVVQLKSGGYVVLNQTEALVAIDVNSGRATRERHIEETALKTNLEAAAELARQLRLRDLAGLIVIDFIDMEEQRHNNAVERKLKEAMRLDRARIQIGRISPFGLLELSRQRLRPSLVEASTEVCRFCRGIGHVRSTESTALHMLRSIEEEAIRKPAPGFNVTAPTAVALYILNQKRRALADIEMRHGVRIYVNGDDKLIRPDFELERLKELLPGELPPAALPPVVSAPEIEEEIDLGTDEADGVEETETGEATVAERPAEREGRGRRRRGRRRGRGGEDRGGREQAPREPLPFAESPALAMMPDETGGGADDEFAPAQPAGDGDDQPRPPLAADGDGDRPRRRRRRGRRGGRRRRGRQQDAGVEIAGEEQPIEEQPRPPRPVIPSPADFRFAGDADISGEDEDADIAAAARANAGAIAEDVDYEDDTAPDRPDDERGGGPDSPAEQGAPETQIESARGTDAPDAGQQDAGDRSGRPDATGAVQGDANAPRRGGWWQRRGFGS